MSTVPGFASMVISGFVNLNLSPRAEMMFDIPPVEISEGVPPPKYTVPISGISISRHLISISFNIALIYSFSGIFSGVNDMKLQYGHLLMQKGI